MAKTPSKLINIATRHQLFLEGHKTHIANQFDPFLKQMVKSLEKRIATKQLTEFSRDRTEKLIAKLQEDISDIYKNYYGVWKDQIVDFAKYESEFEVKSLKQIVEFDFVAPSRKQLQSAVFIAPLNTKDYKGYLLKPFFEEWSERTIKKVGGIIRNGYTQGLTTPQIVREIKGTKGLKFADGQLARGKKDITLVTRTALQHTANEARQETWKENKDIVKGVRIVATLDDSTTAECRSRDGLIYPIGSGEFPPYHIGCRTTTAAVLDERYSFLDSNSTRAARNESGKVEYVPAKQTYYEWLKTQPDKVQEFALGKQRAKLFRDGGISAERFKKINVGKDYQQISLDELRKLEPLAFERAGL